MLTEQQYYDAVLTDDNFHTLTMTALQRCPTSLLLGQYTSIWAMLSKLVVQRLEYSSDVN